MDLITLTVATNKIELRCNSGLRDAERMAVMDEIGRLPTIYPEIKRVYVDIERDAVTQPSGPLVAKGRVDLGGSDILASVADQDAFHAVNVLIENFERQLRRRKEHRVRVSLRAPSPIAGSADHSTIFSAAAGSQQSLMS